MKNALLMILLVFILIAGCSNNIIIKSDEEIILRVAYDNDKDFHLKYGNMFRVIFPNVRFEVYPIVDVLSTFGYQQKVMLENYMNTFNPDVLILNAPIYSLLSSEGYLINLSTFQNDSGFDLGDFHPHVTKKLKELSNGEINGLATGFSAKALFYNKDIFDRFGIPHPSDSMSWDEVLHLAQRIPRIVDDERFFGLSRTKGDSDILYVVLDIAVTNRLSIINNNNELTVNTKEWAKVIELAIQAYSNGYLTHAEDFKTQTFNSYEESLLSGHFMSGHAAMIIGDQQTLFNLLKISEMFGKNHTFDWGIVTAPADNDSKSFTADFFIHNIFSISAKSENIDMAWEFVKFVNSEETSNILTTTSDFLPSRTALIERNQYYPNFVRLEPMEYTLIDSDNTPAGFFSRFMPVLKETLDSIIVGQLDIVEALEELEAKGSFLLKEEIEQEKYSKEFFKTN